MMGAPVNRCRRSLTAPRLTSAAHAGPYRGVGAVSGTDSLAQALLCLFFGGVKCGFECGERGAEQVW